jgi:hypothetical protein
MVTNDGLYTPEVREEVKKRNRLSLPRWMRDLLDDNSPMRKHNREQENTRRIAQIRRGVLNLESRGTVKIK